MHLPPPDPALPDLPVLLDGAATAVLLETYLADFSTGRLDLADCVPVYVRYKPGTSALIQYRLQLRDTSSGEIHPTTAFFRMFSDEHGAQQWGRRSFGRLLAQAEAFHPAPPRARAAYLPEMRALLQVYPIDRDLKPLVRVAAPAQIQAALQEVLVAGLGAPAAQPGDLIRYKPARKALLRVPWEGGPVDAAYVKVLSDDRGAMLARAAESLTFGGLRTPQVLAHQVEDRVIVHEAIAGVPLSALRGTQDYCDAMAPAAEALARLHASNVPELFAHTLAVEVSVVRIACETVRTLSPPLAARMDTLAMEVTDALLAEPEREATLHGDFYDDQVLVDGGELAVIDLDEIRRGHPLIDVGNMLAHLTVADARGVPMAEARGAFLAASEYGDEAALPGFETAALLKLAVGPFRRLEADWPEAMERIVVCAESCLRAGRR